MKKILASTLAALFMTGAAQAATLGMANVGGLNVEPRAGSSVTLNVAQAGTVNEIAFNLGVYHNAPSWGSETRIYVTAPDGSDFSYRGSDFGWGYRGGYFSTTSSFAVASTSALGLWTILFNDSYDDGSATPDYITMRGSSISLNGTPVAAVPLPASALLLLGGVAGLGLTRRRRKAA